ncbi:hypothetical protein EV178_004527 [Coemansia sp. RSA 1646]|nr:hypothetical protein EV178_004527 [Coemansia sp. RSA 1646]KAJ2212739.1 hypothetical protein EV179_004392 [Coemansia sp. RSA 487]
MKCSQCSKDVHIRLIGEHQCLGRPDVPEMPPGMMSRGLSSFFDAPEEPASRGTVSRYNNPQDPIDSRKAVESRMFPAAYKPSLQLLSEDAGADEFDFDEMLNNASSFRPGAMSNESLEEVISPGPRKVPVFNSSNSNLSLDGLSPYDGLASARRDMTPGEQLSARSTGSEFSLKNDMRPKHNMATSQNSLMQHMSSNVVVPPVSESLPARQPSMAKHDREVEQPLSSSSSSSAFTLSTVPSPVNPTAGTSSAAIPSRSFPSQKQGPNSRNNASSQDTTNVTMSQSSDTSHYHRDQKQRQHDERQKQNQKDEEQKKRKQQEQAAAAAAAAATAAAAQRMPPNNGRYLHRKTSSSAHGPAAETAEAAAAPSVTAAAPIKVETSRGHDNAISPSSSSLSIGNMMKAQTTKARREAGNGLIVRRQGSAPTSPTYPSNSSDGGSSPRRQQQAVAHSPTATDNQIRISAKRPALGNSSGSPTFSSPLHETPFKSSSFTSPSSNLSSSLRTAKEDQQRNLTRNATAPASMNASSSALMHPAGGGPGKARSTNPLDVLASLVPPSNGMALGNPSAAATIPPHINTQVGGRLAGQHMRKPSGPRSGGGSGGGGAKSHKTARLDSLLDDLMGEMQALNIEVRSESDRDSTISTASLSNNSSPYDMAARDVRDHNNPLRGRFDSTVSTASTSSTLSTGGSAHRRQVHCATCGVGISTSINAVLRSSGLRTNDIPASVQGIEHQNRVYCVRDYRRLLTKCRGCGKQCETSAKDSVNALDAWWHRACFNCQECHKPFPDKSFYVFENRPYCRYDYHKLNKSLCVACHEPIEGPCAQVFEGRFHPGCFACYQCGEPLRDVYYSLDGFFLCENHVHKHKSNRSANKRMTVFGHV